MTLAQKVKTYQLKGTFQHSFFFFFLLIFLLLFVCLFID